MFVCYSTPASDWTDADTKREAAFYTLRTVTFLQTYSAARDGWENHYEQNKLLGKYPSKEKVTTYYIVHSLVHLGVSYILPPEWRQGFQYVTIGEVGAAAIGNHASGVRITLKL